MLLTYILATFTVLSLVLTLWQWLVATTFRFENRSDNPVFFPPLSILKPVKGADSQTAECLRSWCAAPYAGSKQILFGVASGDDPACAVIRSLIAEFPRADAQLVICPENHGANAKISILIQLEQRVTGEVVIVSDADVLAPPELLREVVQPLQQSAIGLVNCFYRLTNAANFGMRWEAFAINADFWSQVLQAKSLRRLDFAMGAVMALRKTTLSQIGGFSALADYLADDYQLGHRVAGSGRRIVICPVIVECRSATLPWKDVWLHQTRWARTIRVSQPIPYFFSKLSNATFWPLLWMGLDPGPRSFGFGAFCLVVRMIEAFYCERKMIGRPQASSFWMAPLKDLLQIAIWISAFAGNRIIWRGREFRVTPDGKLIEVLCP